MKFVKSFIIFIFLLTFVFQVSAQNKTQKLIWENLQETYQDFADIKPQIKNIFDKPIYIYPSFGFDDILAFDNTTNEWLAGKYIFACGNSPNLRFSTVIKLKPNESLDLSKELDWEYLLLGPFNSGSFKDKSKADWENIRYYKQNRKYKLVTFYSEKKNKNIRIFNSPEFWVNPAN